MANSWFIEALRPSVHLPERCDRELIAATPSSVELWPRQRKSPGAGPRLETSLGNELQERAVSPQSTGQSIVAGLTLIVAVSEFVRTLRMATLGGGCNDDHFSC